MSKTAVLNKRTIDFKGFLEALIRYFVTITKEGDPIFQLEDFRCLHVDLHSSPPTLEGYSAASSTKGEHLLAINRYEGPMPITDRLKATKSYETDYGSCQNYFKTIDRQAYPIVNHEELWLVEEEGMAMQDAHYAYFPYMKNHRRAGILFLILPNNEKQQAEMLYKHRLEINKIIAQYS